MARITMILEKGGKVIHEITVEPVDARALRASGYTVAGEKKEKEAPENPLKGLNPAKYTELINACETAEEVDALVEHDSRAKVAEAATARKEEIAQAE